MVEQTKKGIAILGATGSVGVSTLGVIHLHPNRYDVIALSAHTNVEKMLAQCLQFTPKYAVMVDADAATRLEEKLQNTVSEATQVLTGAESLEWMVCLPEVDYVMAAIVGAAGLLPTLAAAKAKKRILLANKEALVMSGKLFMDIVHENNVELLPIDSEHNAIFQCLPQMMDKDKKDKQGIEKILLTGSGGPFRTRAIDSLHQVTVAEAVAHPNWDMGKKISVDSATMMNKGLEIIEACWLFDIDLEQLQVVVHPQSTIHSMVAYCDGSVIAQLGSPDMRTPIAYSLAWPERMASGVAALDFFNTAQFSFEKPNLTRFPCLRLAQEAHQMGGNATIALNAANEVAVEAFLTEKIRFTDIPLLIESVMTEVTSDTPSIVEEILIQDRVSREISQSWLKNHSH